jgi:hypothetical protein
MERVQSVEDAVVGLVREFMDNIESMNPFETHLMEFKLRLRAKLLEIFTSYPTDRELATKSLSYAVEGIGEVLRDRLRGINTDSEEVLYRTVRTLETVNSIIKEFMYSKEIEDKKVLSSVSGFIASSLETLRKSYGRKTGGVVGFIKGLLGLKRRL